MDYESLGRKIRLARAEKRWTQYDLAEHAGISASFLGHIERGSRKASLETLINIANALHSGTDRFLADSLLNPFIDSMAGDLDENTRRTMAGALQLLLDRLNA